MTGCKDDVMGDLVLTERNLGQGGKRIPGSKKTVKHVYLCQRHFDDMLDFLETLEKKEE